MTFLVNSRYYSFDPLSESTNIKFKQKQKYEVHLLVWLAVSSRGVSSPYIHRSKIAVRGEMYSKTMYPCSSSSFHQQVSSK